MDQAEQLEHWVEHYLELYATQNVITDAALAAIPDLPVMEELDTPPTEEELSKAINSLASGKSPGSDSIPVEVLKSGEPALPMLGGRIHPSGHARRNHRHPLQKQG